MNRLSSRQVAGLSFLAPLALSACAGSAPARSNAPGSAATASPPVFAADAETDSSALSRGHPSDAGLASTEHDGPAAIPSLAVGEAGGPSSASSASAASPSAANACNEQLPQDFLIRSNFLRGGTAAAQRAVQYRTDNYGYFTGFGRPGADSRPPSAFVVGTTFMGLPIKMHRKVVPALRCAEAAIKLACTEHPYVPHALAGIRFRNTYRGGEVTNHIYGIAIDVDPSINTCCGCVAPWNEAPACQRKANTEYDRMAMPECWVHAFERYGFYWLGHDVLRDTMHFEFLGDPERILKSAEAAKSDADAASPAP